MYYTVIKHNDHLRTLEKCRKHLPATRVFYISPVFSNDHRVLSQCNTRLRLLYLLIILAKRKGGRQCLIITVLAKRSSGATFTHKAGRMSPYATRVVCS